MRDRSAPLTVGQVGDLAWEKMGGLLPAVVQDAATGQALMLAYMDREALEATLASGEATFFSRSKQRLWRKGETSGNVLDVVAVHPDCDGDALLVRVRPRGPACHLGTTSCFTDEDTPGVGWLERLAGIVAARAASEQQGSYTPRMMAEGTARIAQKIGEEGVELALAAVSRDTDACIEETADLVYHLTVLMQARGYGWGEVANRLRERRTDA